ncbi:ABC transporter permease subunit [Agromyces endophyticus]|uniref:ABC transporter permease n=1 Tax=Agromyces sp. H17E-10 TaxID=2932244 RepID=UPI001FD25763|nr:ABC transporter permease subunit [Agromyces sp. H17E-10]UOQ91044.1 ABC transporter permease subunit [Agromyces sp. H17E-10]
MNEFRLPLGQWAAAFIDFVTEVFGGFFTFVRDVFAGFYDLVELVLQAPPFWVVILAIAALAWFARGWKLAVGSAIGLLVIVGVDQWDNAMATLALVLVASAIAVVVAVPVGVLAARSDGASRVIRPILDFMQTMPAMVYLIPALILFRVGVVPGIVATIIFAMAPGVRLTELGIRGVDREVVEAGQAFGSSPWRILRQIQLPLAMPSIMAGVNQVIMLSLSMVVIAGMVGAGGLGGDVVQSLTRIDVGLGFEAGVSVVILAIILDRITGALGAPRARRRRRPVADASAPTSSAAADAGVGDERDEPVPVGARPEASATTV